MKKILLVLGLILISLLSIGGCKIETAYGLTIETSDFVKVERTVDGTTRVVPRNSDVFKRGEKVNFILLNVGEFKKGNDGLNWFDMNIEVKDHDGNIIFSQEGMLGGKGHINLPNNIATSPYAAFQTAPLMEPGKYNIKLIIYDVIGGGSASISRSFILE